ncbi:MAG TPA: ATP-binding protein [Clostridiales bacterium]|jgi:putative ATP-dependent endonuclease of OLD family|nr:ATP-binding protein [Clostridiales bacterium]
MKLKEVIIKNFRGYSHETRIRIDAITALIGKNDVGKSTILEALDIFFNQTKIDLKDKNVFLTDEDTEIGCSFDELPEEIVLDERVSTSLSREHLLNEQGYLEIRKKYSNTGKESIWIYANHPSNDGYDDLLSKKNSELKAKVREAGLDNQVNLSINSEMRQVLWNSLNQDITFAPKYINADQADERKLWPKIVPFLPAYRLFKADRPSTDEDNEAQDPMQHAMKIAIEEQAEQLSSIANEVQRKVTEVANRTIEKLCEFDPGLAATLTPQFKKDPMWEKAFSFSLTGENAIPLNKRGSGVRRLVLFSFFRATTESQLFNGKNIIYAVEEPETSQHPDAQKAIIKTFMDMTENNNCQIILTTHVPGLAGLLPLESLRYITDDDGYPCVASDNGDETLLKKIADALGVYPDLTPAMLPHHIVKLIVCVEGPNDVEFINAISRIAHQEDDQIQDLNISPAVVVMPLGGGTLKNWVNCNYLRKLNTPEYHIYDNDNTNAHAIDCDRINARGNGSSARLTRKREMENYIHSDVIQEIFDVRVEVDDTMDVSTVISCLIRATNPDGYSPDTVKKKLNRFGAPKMTLALLKDRDPDDEVLTWLREISQAIQ